MEIFVEVWSMNKNINPLLVKWIATFVIAVICFRFLAHGTWTTIFLLSVATVLVNSLIGDVVVLPVTGSALAAACDGVLGVVAALLFAVFSPVFNPSAASLVVYGVLIAVFEYVFHIYLVKTGKLVQ